MSRSDKIKSIVSLKTFLEENGINDLTETISLTNRGKDDDYQCPICLQFAFPPYQYNCCGKLVCEACQQNPTMKISTCPTCRAQNKPFKDFFKTTEILGLKIRCDFSTKGCEWFGSITTYECHLKESCCFVELKCKMCSEKIKNLTWKFIGREIVYFEKFSATFVISSQHLEIIGLTIVH